jgi:hypothetical protein
MPYGCTWKSFEENISLTTPEHVSFLAKLRVARWLNGWMSSSARIRSIFATVLRSYCQMLWTGSCQVAASWGLIPSMNLTPRRWALPAWLSRFRDDGIPEIALPPWLATRIPNTDFDKFHSPACPVFRVLELSVIGKASAAAIPRACGNSYPSRQATFTPTPQADR